MKHRLGYLLLVFIFVSMACQFPLSGGSTPVPTEEAVKPTAPTPTLEKQAEPTQSEVTQTTSDKGTVKSLGEAEKAVVRIVTQGAYEFADYGTYEQSFTGSGFVISPDGKIITNNHVVTGAALVNVFFNGDPKPHQARVLGASECSDLAMIQIKGEDLPYFNWSDHQLNLGDEVYSMGYPLGDPELSQHKGTISKEHASSATSWTDAQSVVEHDAIINPGSSGGPLITVGGEVVGINYASLASANQYYAISYEEAKPILDKLQAGKNDMWIGVNGEAFQTKDGFSGIWIYSVASGSPADKAGVKPGDIILEMEGITLGKNGTMADYCNILRGRAEDSVTKIKVVRSKTGEVLEGQINGRALEVTGTFDIPKSSGSNSSGTVSGDYFTEEFDGDISHWKTFTVVGNTNNKFAEGGNGKLTFSLPRDMYGYVYNDAYSYSDVYVSTQVQTAGGCPEGIALICRASDVGWYELRVSTCGSNAGSFAVYRYDVTEKEKGRVPYVQVIKGVDRIYTTAIKTGTAVNELGLSCSGNLLRIFINGVEQRSPNGKDFEDSTLTQGNVGIGVMSPPNGPVKVEFESLTTSQP